jgi:uncharacterized protein
MTWIQTHSGRRIDILAPQYENIRIGDIVHSLARINRFNGHLDCERYSVAQHSVTCAKLAAYRDYDVETQLWALLHDAHEFVTGYITSPMKRVINDVCGKDVFTQIENRLDDAILLALRIKTPSPRTRKLVAEIDSWMAAHEADTRMLGKCHRDWVTSHSHFPNESAFKNTLDHRCWEANEAEDAFISLFVELRNDLAVDLRPRA